MKFAQARKKEIDIEEELSLHDMAQAPGAENG
jgi:hypothetical protein